MFLNCKKQIIESSSLKMGVMVVGASWLEMLVVHGVGLLFAFVVLLRLLWSFVTSPRRFVVDTFFNKRDVMPACLSDPALGSHGFVHLEAVKLHYVASGDESKPLMLFLHGFPEFWYSWRHQIREFNKDYRVVAVDMRGYADSDKPNGYKNYQIDILDTDIKQLIAALGYESCVLVAHDWGGVVAWHMATIYPDLIERLIIMNCPHGSAYKKFIKNNRKQMAKSWYVMFFQIPLVPELMIRAMDYQVLNLMLQKLGKDGSMQQMGTDETMKSTSVTDEDVEAYKYAYSRPGAITATVNYYRALVKIKPSTPTGEIRVPTLLVWGIPDPYLSTEMAALSRDYVKDITIKYVENSGHFVQMESPQEVNRIMRDYLSSKM